MHKNERYQHFTNQKSIHTRKAERENLISDLQEYYKIIKRLGGGVVAKKKTKRLAMNVLSACTILYASEDAQLVS